MAMLELPPWLLGTFFMVVAAFAGTVPFYLLRRRWPREVPQESRELGAQVALRVSVLYSVILGMVFADVQNSYNDVRLNVQREATELIGVFTMLELLSSREARDLQSGILEYVHEVVNVEWPTLGSTEISLAPGKLLAEIHLKVIELPRHDASSDSVRESVLAGIEEVKRLHRSQVVASLNRVPYLFWWVVVIGFVVIGALFMVFRPTMLNMVLVSAFSAMTGIVLFFIFAMSNPFSGPARIEPTPFGIFIDKAGARVGVTES